MNLPGIKLLILVLIATQLLVANAIADPTTDEIRLYVPAFDGPGSLGKNVATILNLQIWRTLRKEPDKDPKGEDFGRGMMV